VGIPGGFLVRVRGRVRIGTFGVDMSEPKSLEEFNEKFAKNQRYEGYGLGNVFCHYPCPFCAEPDFAVVEILQTRAAFAQGHVCKHCKRGSKALISGGMGSTRFEFVQTEGPDQPEWMRPKMRRV
jgi:hypothetical protein